MAELYKQMGEGWNNLDFSDSAFVEMYNSESYGTPVNKNSNGFYIGKQWLNVQIEMWKEDRGDGFLCISELYIDDRWPHWFLDSIFK